ncbi:ATP-binding protein [Phenylobacterium sp.]|jgi:signal transduction histidine kinase/ActR/RegA family two-component response regulator|uniref:ATP-binding protein n=1 Tax=Phenylobacterium sp. TaxID=1871053 RepID=UPI0037832991
MLQVIGCVTENHDLGLVFVSAVICAVASCAAFGFHRQSRKAREGLRSSWLILAALVAGSGVWATHFIAMLAYQPTLNVAYEPIGTIASLLLAILGMAAAFTLSLRRPDLLGVVESGVAAGLSIAAMHYVGIAAIRTNAALTLALVPVVASIALAILGGVAAFAAARRRSWIVAAPMFLFAVCGLHFTAMSAVVLTPDPTILVHGPAIGRTLLAVATTVLAGLILTAAVALVMMERLAQRAALQSVRGALDTVPAGLVFYDAEGRLQNWNHAMDGFMADIGVTPRVGMSRSLILSQAKAAGWFDFADADALSDAGEWRSRAAEFRLPDHRWIRREDFPTASGGGVTVLTDVTEQRLQTEALAAARDAAEAASRAKSAFLANMSHEIRTPLNGVLGIADVLAHSGLSPKQAELVGVMQSSGALLNALLTDLLDLARVEAGVEALEPEPANLAAIVSSAADLFSGRAAQKGLKLRAAIDLGEETWVNCDGRRLRQVLGNLLNNAVKFTDAGEVMISAVRCDDKVMFAVTDTGPGFDEATKAGLFGRFQQADDSSTRRHGGAGLGLSICQEYIRLMGGELDCVSVPGRGSTFAFTLDLSPIATPADAAAEPPSAESGGFRVLVVDDNAVNRKVLGLILESAAIGHVDVEDGAQAVTAVEGGAFDAILMDLQMPVMDGLEATRRIRALEQRDGRPRTPIFMVSANCLQEHMDAGLSAGADGHLSKPVSVSELLAALGRPRPAQAEAA